MKDVHKLIDDLIENKKLSVDDIIRAVNREIKFKNVDHTKERFTKRKIFQLKIEKMVMKAIEDKKYLRTKLKIEYDFVFSEMKQSIAGSTIRAIRHNIKIWVLNDFPGAYASIHSKLQFSDYSKHTNSDPKRESEV